MLRLYLYYPASYCHLYEPSLKAGEQLADFYKRGQWYLPAAGELCRLRWWHLNGYVPPTTEPEYEVKRPIFAAASAAINSNSDVVFQKFAGAGYWSSTEYNAGSAWYVNFSNGNFNNNNKNNNNYVFPVVAMEKRIYDIPFSDILEAYEDCTRHKKGKQQCIEFSLNKSSSVFMKTCVMAHTSLTAAPALS